MPWCNSTASATTSCCGSWGRRSRSSRLSWPPTPDCLAWLARRGYSEEFGAREIARLVSTKLKDFFVEEILFGRLSNGGAVRADIENDEVALTVL
jgi:ATP-dependent Clp protease ATP-binding subunit ClpA